MKQFLFAMVTLATLAFMPVNDSISKKERGFAVKFLKETEGDVLDKVKGLNDAQLKFKPAADRWSVEECLMHIAVTEKALWEMTANTLKQPANPEKRSDIKKTDEEVVQMVESREKKVKTMDPFKPENTGFKTAEDAINSFKENRAKLIIYAKNTQDDLRNHVATLPFATVDCYQMLLFIGAHSNRHAQQIAEVMADPGFPKQ